MSKKKLLKLPDKYVIWELQLTYSSNKPENKCEEIWLCGFKEKGRGKFHRKVQGFEG